MMIEKEEISVWFQQLQDSICKSLEDADGMGVFKEDLWNRAGGGGGRTRVIQHGKIIEKGGVNFSAVFGATPENVIKALQLTPSDFYATGVSIVLHPYNPFVPIIHMNVRYFEMLNGTYWFGGGIDLTPHYIDRDDARYFHQQLKAVCDRFDPFYYDKFKHWADDYFFIKHRNETRGIGGIFFDRLSEDTKHSKTAIWNFVQAVGEVFAPMYTHFMNKNQSISYNEHHKKWQKIRRGRYVEFNLVWDKGTKFGLDTDGRTESILMSLPPEADWEYQFKVEVGSPEENTLKLLHKGVHWI